MKISFFVGKKKDFDGNELYKCIEEQVKVDEKWIPGVRGFSLYIRPTVIAWEVMKILLIEVQNMNHI